MFHDSTTCKKCSSDNTQSFQMAYESGTTTGQVTVITHDGDGFGVGGGATKSQSLLAQKVTPPVKPEWTVIEIALVFIIPFGAMLFCLTILPIWINLSLAVVAALIMTGVFGYLVWYAIDQKVKKESPVYDIQIARWMRSWICLKCGTTWELKKAKS